MAMLGDTGSRSSCLVKAFFNALVLKCAFSRGTEEAKHTLAMVKGLWGFYKQHQHPLHTLFQNLCPGKCLALCRDWAFCFSSHPAFSSSPFQFLQQQPAPLMPWTSTWKHLAMRMNMPISRKPRSGWKLSTGRGCPR